MKYVFLVLAINIFAITCASFAGYMAIHSIHGWGWFLFSAIISAATPSRIKEDE
jgi:hypothetical protein